MIVRTMQTALRCGIFDITTIQEQINVMKKQIYLDKHIYGVWQDPSGRWTTYLPAKDGKRKLVKKTERSKLEDAIIEYWKNARPEDVFQDYFEEWLQRKLDRCEIQMQSVDKYRATFKRYISTSILNQIEIGEITEQLLDTYIISVIKENDLSAKGWADVRLVLRGTFKYAKKLNATTINIDAFMQELDLSPKIFKRRNREATKNVFQDEELKQIREYIYSQKPLKVVDLGILLSLETGLRAGELIALKFSDYNPDDCTLSICRTEVRTKGDSKDYNYCIREFTKGKIGHRQIILLDGAIDVINKLRTITDSDYMFKGDVDRHEEVFSNRLYRICDSIGIERRSLHKCRKTYATKLINNNVPESIIMAQMGHTDITTTRNYYFFNNMSVKTERETLAKCMG